MRDIIARCIAAVLGHIGPLRAGLPAGRDGDRAVAVAVAGEWQSQDRCARRGHRFAADWAAMGRARMVPRSSFGDHRQ